MNKGVIFRCLKGIIFECLLTWRRCKVHFMRNILAKVPQKEKARFAAHLLTICYLIEYSKDWANERSYISGVSSFDSLHEPMTQAAN